MLGQQNTITTNNTKEKDVKSDCFTIITVFDLKGNSIFF